MNLCQNNFEFTAIMKSWKPYRYEHCSRTDDEDLGSVSFNNSCSYSLVNETLVCASDSHDEEDEIWSANEPLLKKDKGDSTDKPLRWTEHLNKSKTSKTRSKESKKVSSIEPSTSKTRSATDNFSSVTTLKVGESKPRARKDKNKLNNSSKVNKTKYKKLDKNESYEMSSRKAKSAGTSAKATDTNTSNTKTVSPGKPDPEGGGGGNGGKKPHRQKDHKCTIIKTKRKRIPDSEWQRLKRFGVRVLKSDPSEFRLLKALFGFPFGLLMGGVLYLLIIKPMDLDPDVRRSVGSVAGLLIAIGFVLSVQVGSFWFCGFP